LEHIKEVIEEGRADAVSLASLLHYNFLKEFSLNDDFKDEGNIEFIKNRINSLKIKKISLYEIKKFLYDLNIECRYKMTERSNEEEGVGKSVCGDH